MIVLINDFSTDILAEADLNIEMVEMCLILIGSSLPDWLETVHAVTGQYPLMSMAKSNNSNLEKLYEVAMISVPKKDKVSDKKAWNAKRMKLD
jgi:hypothetical protein